MSKYVVEKEKRHLEQLDLSETAWVEGYISAIRNYGIITENEFDELLEFVKPGWLENSAKINAAIAVVKQQNPEPTIVRIIKRVIKIVFPFKY